MSATVISGGQMFGGQMSCIYAIYGLVSRSHTACDSPGSSGTFLRGFLFILGCDGRPVTAQSAPRKKRGR